jgi:phosphatidate cytidylyltransferase
MPLETNRSVTPVAPSKSRVFLRRLGTFTVLWTVIISALFSGNKFLSDYVFLTIMVVLAVLGLREFYSLVAKRGLVCFRGLGILGGLLLMVSAFFYLSADMHRAPSKANDFETSFVIIFVLGLCVRQLVSKKNPAGLEAISTTLFGLMYVPWLLNFIQKINYFPGVNGAYYVLYFILVTKFSDSGAYVVGSLIGRHKMIPRVSPGKTWEGFAGAIVVAASASFLFAHWAGPRLTGMTPIHSIILGVLLATTAVIGDLIESLFKREAGVKDSGSLFPGMGGILDLLDSLLFNAPLMYLYLRHILT